MKLKQWNGFTLLTIYFCQPFLLFPIKYMIKAITATTMIIPVHIPALKISAIAWQLLNAVNKKSKSMASLVEWYFFIFLFFNDYSFPS
jgi:hypothetical protein